MNKNKIYYIDEDESTLTEGFKKIGKRINEQPCCFISAYKEDCSKEENEKRTEQLEAEIKDSELTYIKLFCTSDIIIFCVVDNRYHTDDFELLMKYWCDMFNQEHTYITEPSIIPYGKGDLEYRRRIPLESFDYVSKEDIRNIKNPVTIEDIYQWFKDIYREDFDIIDIEIIVTETPYKIYKPSDALLFCREFKNKYSKLKGVL